MDGRIALAYAKRLYDLAEGPQGPQGEPGSGAVGTVAEAYSTSKTYAVGDYVIHDEEFYRCTTAITTAESFTAAHWTKLVLTDEVSDLKSDLEYFEDYVSEYSQHSTDTTPENTWTSGFWWNKGANASTSYVYSSELSVTEGDVITCIYTVNNTLAPMKFIEVYDSGGNIIDSSAVDVTSYTVPASAVAMRVSPYSAGSEYKVIHQLTDIYDAYTIKESVVDGLPDFKSEISYLRTKYTKTEPENTWTSGIWWNKAASANTSYVYSSEISVKDGDYIGCLLNGAAQSMRFVEVYDKDGNIVGSASSDTLTFKIPQNGAKARITIYSASYSDKVLVLDEVSYVHLAKRNAPKMILSYEKADTGVPILYSLVQNIDNKKNCEYSFSGKFSSFVGLSIGHGFREYGGVYLAIDSTNVTVYSHTGSQFQQFTHGLTFADFIDVSIKVSDTFGARAVLTIQTNGGFYTVDNVIFFGSNGKVWFDASTRMTDVKFTYSIMDLKKDVYVFGDSYIALADNTKWPYYAITNEDNNMLLCGFGGATAQDEILSFRNIMNLHNPKYVCWFLGMNNPDSGAINANWKSCTDEVIAYCESNDIEVILATIPNTPVMNNTYKNAYVKASGHRYVDFARAVGAETSGSSWYTDMLSNDNVHPTENGAKALWLRMLLDCPEIIS